MPNGLFLCQWYKLTTCANKIKLHMPSWFPVILYPGHFVPRSFRNMLVISYPLLFSIWSFCTQFGHFVPSLVISYPLFHLYLNLFWSFRTQFLHFRTQVISYLESFRTHWQISHFVPRLVILYLGTKCLRYEMISFFIQTRYEMTWLRSDFCFVIFWKCFGKKERVNISYIFFLMGQEQNISNNVTK